MIQDNAIQSNDSTQWFTEIECLTDIIEEIRYDLDASFSILSR